LEAIVIVHLERVHTKLYQPEFRDSSVIWKTFKGGTSPENVGKDHRRYTTHVMTTSNYVDPALFVNDTVNNKKKLCWYTSETTKEMKTHSVSRHQSGDSGIGSSNSSSGEVFARSF
jgi:hypothetical protein